MDLMPAVSLAAVPTKRQRSIDLIAEFEARGFSGIYCPSFGDPISLCHSIAERTERIVFGTSILPIYFRQPNDIAAAASYLHEISGGRFRLGLGVSHGPVHDRFGLRVGKPLADTREYVEVLKAQTAVGPLPPIVLATLRDKMVDLSVEIAEGAVWANASRSRMAHSLSRVPADRTDFFIGNMIPTVISDDKAAAAAVNRRTLSGYVALPNYRNYWKSAGYEEEMIACEAAIAAGDPEGVATAMSDRWLTDATLFGSASEVRDGVEAWFDAGVTTPILVPSATDGGQRRAVELLLEAYA